MDRDNGDKIYVYRGVRFLRSFRGEKGVVEKRVLEDECFVWTTGDKATAVWIRPYMKYHHDEIQGKQAKYLKFSKSHSTGGVLC